MKRELVYAIGKRIIHDVHVSRSIIIFGTNITLVTAPDTLAPSHVQASAINSGAAAAKAEASKIAKYSSIAATHTFVPLAFETFGAWGEQAQ